MRPHAGNAVALGTHLGQHACALQRVHDAVMGGAEPPARPRPLVSRSWSRVLSFGLDPTRANARDPLPVEEVERRRRAWGGRSAATGGLPRVHRGRDVERAAGRHQRDRHRPGRAVSGTALPGRALRGRPAPLVLHGLTGARPPHRCPARHRRRQRSGAHPAPRSRGTGRHRDPSSPRRGCGATTSRPSAAFAARPSTSSPRPPARCCSSTTTDGSPTMPGSSCMTASRHRAPTTRSPSRVWACACRSESARAGWCVPAGAPCASPPGSARWTAARCSRCRVPRTPVGGWRASLTPRRATILRLLAGAGPDGMSAGRLSRALFGDDEHRVSVRAEVSRLRRVVGAVVGTAPYRVADGIQLVCDE